MGGSYFFFYAEASVVCILLFGMLLMNDRSNMNRQEKQIVFGQALLAHILYFASDAVWAGIIAGYVPRTHYSVALMNYINFIGRALPQSPSGRMRSPPNAASCCSVCRSRQWSL